MHDCDIDIMAITESWLLPSIPNSFLSVQGYHPIARTDVGDVRKHGVCFYIRDNIPFISIDSNCPNTHIVHLVSLKCYIIVVYRPPSNTQNDNTALINLLEQFCTGKEVLILGDFNLPAVDWSIEDVLFQDYDPLTLAFTNCFNTIGLHQWVDFPTFTSSGNTLDLILSMETDRIGSVESLCPLPGCGHVPIKFTYHFTFNTSQDGNVCIKKRAWERGKYKIIDNHVSQIDWDYEFCHLSVDAKFNRLLQILTPLIDSYIPLCKQLSPSSPLSPPTALKKNRTTAWQLFKSTRRFYGRHSKQCTQALENYNIINRQYRNHFIYSQIAYERTLMDNLKRNPKAFHQYIRNKKVGAPSMGPLSHPDGSLVEDCAAMAEIFVNSFSSVFKDSCPNPFPHQTFQGTLDNVNITYSAVYRP
ncbi:uncharacterized protein LOC123519700 [Portunus trituberculatus]|uniref:uncharacterized protein LOC123519700 n=1 Tax=Portunus trituberculatus TaxID=210409 RepID=UPI001E1CB82A|nr:uncharacterized protein LOC123519700 [Portunus trituberculatus]